MSNGFFSTERLERGRPLREIEPSDIPVEFIEPGRQTWLTKECIEARRGALRFGHVSAGFRTKGRTFDTSQIHSVTLDGKDNAVRVRTHDTVLTIGRGLSRPALEWLRDCIEAAASA